MSRKRHYVGTNPTSNDLLYINDKNEEELLRSRTMYPKLIGPFRTKDSALYYKNTFARCQHVCCVADAELLFKKAKELNFNVMWNIIHPVKKDIKNVGMEESRI